MSRRRPALPNLAEMAPPSLVGPDPRPCPIRDCSACALYAISPHQDRALLVVQVKRAYWSGDLTGGRIPFDWGSGLEKRCACGEPFEDRGGNRSKKFCSELCRERVRRETRKG